MEKSLPYMDGWWAHMKGLTTEDNPYDELKQAYTHGQWLSGWCGRFSALKHDLDLSLDEIYP